MMKKVTMGWLATNWRKGMIIHELGIVSRIRPYLHRHDGHTYAIDYTILGRTRNWNFTASDYSSQEEFWIAQNEYYRLTCKLRELLS